MVRIHQDAPYYCNLCKSKIGEWLNPTDCKSVASATLIRIQPVIHF